MRKKKKQLQKISDVKHLVLTTRRGVPRVSSRQIAAFFGSQHNDVLKLFRSKEIWLAALEDSFQICKPMSELLSELDSQSELAQFIRKHDKTGAFSLAHPHLFQPEKRSEKLTKGSGSLPSVPLPTPHYSFSQSAKQQLEYAKKTKGLHVNARKSSGQIQSFFSADQRAKFFDCVHRRNGQLKEIYLNPYQTQFLVSNMENTHRKDVFLFGMISRFQNLERSLLREKETAMENDKDNTYQFYTDIGKGISRDLNEAISQLIALAETQNPKTGCGKQYHRLINRMIKRSLFEYPDDWPDTKFRSVLTISQLINLQNAQLYIIKEIKKSVTALLPYKEIYPRLKTALDRYLNNSVCSRELLTFPTLAELL